MLEKILKKNNFEMKAGFLYDFYCTGYTDKENHETHLVIVVHETPCDRAIDKTRDVLCRLPLFSYGTSVSGLDGPEERTPIDQIPKHIQNAFFEEITENIRKNNNIDIFNIINKFNPFVLMG